MAEAAHNIEIIWFPPETLSAQPDIRNNCENSVYDWVANNGYNGVYGYAIIR